MAKQQKKVIKPEIKFPSKSIFDNNYIILGILGLFWLIFFRELLSGNAYLFDDFIEQYYPSKFMASVMLSKDIFPFWNPFAFSGVPFFADLQIAVLYPFNYILSFFVQNDRLSALAIQNTIIIHYLLTSVFTFYLARHFKLSGLFSLLFALLFTYSSYMIIHMMHQPLIEAATWFPLFFLFWLKFIDTKKYIYPLMSGVVLALCVLAGYPQVPFFNFFFIAIYTLFVAYSYYKQKNIKQIYHLVYGMIIILFFTFGLTAFQLLPAFEFIGLSNRSSFDYQFAKQGSMHIYDYITLIIPKFFGVWSGNEKITDLQYWSKHSEGPWMFSISNIFTSTLIILLLIPSFRYFFKEKKHIHLAYFSLVIIAFSFMFSLGGNFFFHKLLFDVVPFFNRFRNPAHVVYIMMMAIIMVTMIGTNGILMENKVKEYFSNKYLFITGGIILILFVIVYSGTLLPVYTVQTPQVLSYVKSQGLTFFIIGLLFVAFFYLFSNGKIKLNTFSILVVLLLLFEMYYIWFDQNNGTKNPEKEFSQTVHFSNQFKKEMTSDIFRVNGRAYNPSIMLFKRNLGYVDNVEYIEGYGALMLKNFIPPNGADQNSTQTHDLMNLKYKVFHDSASKGNPLGINPTYLPRVMMFYDAVQFESDSLVKNYMSSNQFDYRRTLAIESKENLNLPKLNHNDSIPVSNIKILERNINSIKVEVDTPEDGLLYFSEVFYPAFKSYVDGKQSEILKADYCMRAVLIPKGKHIVEMNYDSDSFDKGVLYSIITLILLFVSVPVSIVFPRKRKSAVSDESSD
ncbi:MAG: hypothetical protein WC139_09595 [Candidatus Kapaibacterium sp.]